MAIRLSDGIRNFALQHGSIRDALQNGVLEIYTGTQPGSANDAPTGTLLATISDASAVASSEVVASGTVTLTAGTAGSVDSVTVDGVSLIADPIAYNTSLAQTAIDLADAINAQTSSPEYQATAAGAIVTISAKIGSGSSANGFVVTSVATTITTADTDLAGGVDPVAGLQWGNANAGVLVKNPAQAWTGVAVASGTAGWFRFRGAAADGGGVDATGSVIRMDGSVSTSGAQLNLSSTAITAAATQTISTFQIALPAN